MDYERIASALLAEVGLTFDDVVDLGRDWIIGPEGMQTVIGRPRYRAQARGFNRDNPMSRQRPLIYLTGPVDSEIMVLFLAHECGHVAYRHFGKSTKEYVQEFEAETYAWEAFERHLGRPPHPYLQARGRKYVRSHCWKRQRIMNNKDGPRLDWRDWQWGVIAWCGFLPNSGLEEIERSQLFTGDNHYQVGAFMQAMQFTKWAVL